MLRPSSATFAPAVPALGKNGAQRAACTGDNGYLAGEIGVQYVLFHNILLLQLYLLARV